MFLFSLYRQYHQHNISTVVLIILSYTAVHHRSQMLFLNFNQYLNFSLSLHNSS